MERYTLGDYKSVYRDPGSVPINTQLRQQFAQAFAADDALAAAVDQMQAADFAGDQELKKELEDKTRTALEQRASLGNYESMGIDIAKSARQFEKDYSPIKKNKAKYDSYVKAIQKSYDEGKINAFTRDKALAKSKHDYKGLQKNEDGAIDEESYFGGYSYVKDVNIQEKMSEQMKDFAIRKFGNEGKVISKDGDFYITNGTTTETVPKAMVARVFKNLMQDPDVAASVRQQAELSTFDLTDEQIQENIVTDINTLEEARQKAIENKNKAIKDKKDKLATQYNDEIADYDIEIEERQKLLDASATEQDPELLKERKNYALNSEINKNISRELQVSLDKFAYENVHTKYAIDYSEKWKIGYEDFVKNYQPNIFKRTEVSEINNPGGNNLSSIEGYVDGQDKLISQEVRAVNEMAAQYLKEGQRITEEDILNGTVPDEILEVLPEFKDRIVMARTQKFIQQNLLAKAKKETGYDPDDDLDMQKKFLATKFKGTVGTGKQTITGEQIVDAMSEYFGQDIDISRALEMLTFVKQGRRSKVVTKQRMPDGSLKEVTGQQMLRAIADISDKNYNTSFGFNGIPDALIDEFRAFEGGYLSTKNKKIDEWLKDNANVNTAGMTSNNMPGLSDEEVQKNTKYVKNYFTGNSKEGLPLDKSFKIFYDGKKQEGTGTVASFIKDKEWDGEDINVTQVSFDTTPYMGEPTLQLTVTGKKDDNVVSENIILPYSNIKSEEMDRYFQAPGYRLQMEINMHKHTPGATEAPLGVYKNGELVNSMDVSFDENRGDRVTLRENGNIKIYNVNSPEFSAFVNDAAAKGFEIRTRID